MADHTRLEELTLKRLLGEITPEEDNELESLAQASEENKQFIERMRPEEFHKRRESLRGIDYDKLDQALKGKIGDVPGILDWVPATRKERRLLPYTIGIAASFLLILSGAWGFYYKSRTIVATLSWQSTPGNDPRSAATDLIDLGKMEEGKAYPAGRILIARMRNQFFIIPEQDNTTATRDTLPYHFSVDGNRDIQVFFPDSTRMQLSPKSSIAFELYPRGTVVKEKQLICDGQALFNVSPNFNIPTVVKTWKQKITVLGTFFKVRDYKTEDTGAVFCYTGKVSVKDAGQTIKTVLASQRITVGLKHEPKVSTGDFPQEQWSSEELLFDFSDMRLNSAMNEIASWYGIHKVKYRGQIDTSARGVVYFGKLSRHLTPQRLLALLDRNDLHFSIQDGAILVAGSTSRPDHSH